MKQYVKLCQIVDTIKLHYYHGDATTQNLYNKYVNFIEKLKGLKEEAQLIHHSNNEMRFVNTQIGPAKFRVMATTFRGFAITIKNQDVTISLKTLSTTQKDKDTKEEVNDEFLKLTENPIIKVEFRASYLARVGHESAIRFVNKIIEHHLLSDYKIKVSELHLATDIQGHNFDMLDYYRFKTRKRTNNLHDEENTSNSYFYNGRKFTGFTFGTGDEMLRIYNKTIEIQKHPDKQFIKFFAWENNPDYVPENDVWRIEIQYRREKLKTIYDSEHGLLDGFVNVLASIPSLWNRALEKIQFLDLKHDYCMDSMLGYKVANNIKYPIEKNTILQRIKRAVIHPLWEFLKGWLGYEANETNVYDAPKTSSFQWVSNSIKSLFSTLFKHTGELNPAVLESAFIRADNETLRDKQLTLLDNAYVNTMHYLGHVEKEYQEYGVEVMPRSHFNSLKKNVGMYVREVSRHVFTERPFKFDENVNRSRILIKTLERKYA